MTCYDKQKDYVKYSFLMAGASPWYNAHQIYKINKPNQLCKNFPIHKFARPILKILPGQFALRFLQVQGMDFTKQIHSVFSFGLVGLTQSLIYGHANQKLAKNITKNIPKYAMYRGIHFGVVRDIISQGLPFTLANGYLSVLGWTVVGTLVSHPLQIMQTYAQTGLKNNISIQSFSAGLSSRMCLLGVTNIFNNYFLKPHWVSDQKKEHV